MKFDKICRICLMEKSNLKNLFEACIANMLMSCANVQIMEGDGFPDKICSQCLLALNRSHSFKRQCEESDITLKNFIIFSTQQEIPEIPPSTQTDTNTDSSATNLYSYRDMEIFDDHRPANEVVSDLAETMESLQTIAEQCLPESWVETETQLLLYRGEQELCNNLEPLFKCQFCEDILKDEWSLAEHIKNHTGENKYFCNICNKLFYSSNKLNEHIIEHTFIDLDDKNDVLPKIDGGEVNGNNSKKGRLGEIAFGDDGKGFGSFVCSICDRRFMELKYLKKHSKDVHFILDPISMGELEKKHMCNICGKSYKQNRNLANHMRKHTGEKPLGCEICGKCFSLPSSLEKHRNVHSENRQHSCSVCGKMFSQTSHLNEHLKIHLGEKSYSCNVCGKRLSSNTTLTVHMRIHTGIKPYPCEFCEQCFTTNSQLKKHRMIHTGEKPYHCWRCGQNFRRKETRDTHMRYHTGERPYSCRVCEKKYIAASHLREHMKTHSNEKRFECAVCLKKFFDSKKLKNHIMSHCGKN